MHPRYHKGLREGVDDNSSSRSLESNVATSMMVAHIPTLSTPTQPASSHRPTPAYHPMQEPSTSDSYPSSQYSEDFEKLRRLKELILSGQHPDFKPIPRPDALEALWLGPRNGTSLTANSVSVSTPNLARDSDMKMESPTDGSLSHREQNGVNAASSPQAASLGNNGTLTDDTPRPSTSTQRTPPTEGVHSSGPPSTTETRPPGDHSYNHADPRPLSGQPSIRSEQVGKAAPDDSRVPQPYSGPSHAPPPRPQHPVSARPIPTEPLASRPPAAPARDPHALGRDSDRGQDIYSRDRDRPREYHPSDDRRREDAYERSRHVDRSPYPAPPAPGARTDHYEPSDRYRADDRRTTRPLEPGTHSSHSVDHDRTGRPIHSEFEERNTFSRPPDLRGRDDSRPRLEPERPREAPKVAPVASVPPSGPREHQGPPSVAIKREGPGMDAGRSNQPPIAPPTEPRAAARIPTGPASARNNFIHEGVASRHESVPRAPPNMEVRRLNGPAADIAAGSHPPPSAVRDKPPAPYPPGRSSPPPRSREPSLNDRRPEPPLRRDDPYPPGPARDGYPGEADRYRTAPAPNAPREPASREDLRKPRDGERVPASWDRDGPFLGRPTERDLRINPSWADRMPPPADLGPTRYSPPPYRPPPPPTARLVDRLTDPYPLEDRARVERYPESYPPRPRQRSPSPMRRPGPPGGRPLPEDLDPRDPRPIKRSRDDYDDGPGFYDRRPPYDYPRAGSPGYYPPPPDVPPYHPRDVYERRRTPPPFRAPPPPFAR